jgi:hypothetical protein
MTIPSLVPSRFPNFFDTQFVDKQGYLTDPWRQILQQLFTQLQLNMGNEGLVAPSQTNPNMLIIQNNQNAAGENTAAYGTLIYNTDTNMLNVALDNGSGAPVFYPITTT